ncbi:MAG TPA: acyltransferase [Jiangellaceae bacterium]|nr:acyltransferase [Jiangellaceae bacterium]
MPRRRDRDPRQARYLTAANLRWVVRKRAWTPFYLVRYWRLLKLRVRHPEVVTEGLVFLGRGVEVEARRGYGRVVLGRWVHLGDGTALRAHEGTLRVGDKVVFGRHNTVNCYLDVEVGAKTLIADWVHITDFDHRFDDLDTAIKDQGIVKSPVRIGPDCWIGVKVSVLRGSIVGAGCVLAAHAVVRGELPDRSVAGGIPAKVLKRRGEEAGDDTVPRAKARTRRRTAVPKPAPR